MNQGSGAGPANVVTRWGAGGTSARDALIFVNSLATTGAMWDAVVTNLPTDLGVIRFDQRDRGHHGGRPFALDDLVDDVVTVLDENRVERAHEVGVSLGGLVALRAAQLRPERVSSVTAMCCAARFSPDVWLERGRTVRTSGIAPITDPVMHRWFTPEFQEARPDIVTRYRDMFASTDVVGYAYACDLLAEADIRADLPSIQVPTLVVSGDADQANPVSDQELIAERVPRARHEVLPVTAHLAPVAAPTEVARLIAQHVQASR